MKTGMHNKALIILQQRAWLEFAVYVNHFGMRVIRNDKGLLYAAGGCVPLMIFLFSCMFTIATMIAKQQLWSNMNVFLSITFFDRHHDRYSLSITEEKNMYVTVKTMIVAETLPEVPGEAEL